MCMENLDTLTLIDFHAVPKINTLENIKESSKKKERKKKVFIWIIIFSIVFIFD